MTIIIIIAWNEQKNRNLIYERWLPNLKYIWLIIYKFILDKTGSDYCMLSNKTFYFLIYILKKF